MKDTILVVDDEKILALMDKILSKKYKTITAKDGAEGLELFKENSSNIKLIVTDERMPRMTGSEMVEEIKKIKPDVPVIFVSGQKIVYEGGHMYLRKPFNIVDLDNMVKTVMESYQSGSGEFPKIE